MLAKVAENKHGSLFHAQEVASQLAAVGVGESLKTGPIYGER